jgi:hypothetical protein
LPLWLLPVRLQHRRVTPPPPWSLLPQRFQQLWGHWQPAQPQLPTPPLPPPLPLPVQPQQPQLRRPLLQRRQLSQSAHRLPPPQRQLWPPLLPPPPLLLASPRPPQRPPPPQQPLSFAPVSRLLPLHRAPPPPQQQLRPLPVPLLPQPLPQPAWRTPC